MLAMNASPPRVGIHFLCRLIAPERQASPSTFHNRARRQATENARFIILRWVQLR